MNRAADYAGALVALVESNPAKAGEYLANLKQVLARRGHEKLLPSILSECQKLALKAERSVAYREVTPQKERTRVLLELYRRLTATA